MIETLCRNCGQPFPRYSSLQRLCGRCVDKTLKPKKPMKKIGKVTEKWIETRKDWISRNPPDSKGLWECYLKISPYCLGFMNKDSLTIDHVKSRSRHPELRYDLDNLKPACAPCNGLKGSVEYDTI